MNDRTTQDGSDGRLDALTVGMSILWGGNRVTNVDAELAEAFAPGDRLIVMQHDGALLHVPHADTVLAETAVASAAAAFAELRGCSDAAISTFFGAFADQLADDRVFAAIAAANAHDVETARSRGRSVTRLELSAKMRDDMIAGLRMWRDQPGGRDEPVAEVVHEGWSVEQRRAPLGVVAFVFEGRPNVFADATGVLRSGNTVVFRIGSDALGTAREIMRSAVRPALEIAGLPEGAVVLVDSATRSSGWALFSQPSLGLAVARGSGAAVGQLGAIARQAGVPVSLHGTGGAWMIVAESADLARFERVAYHSLDRKVCNTLNVCCVVRSRLADALTALRSALDAAAARRGTGAKLHVVDGTAVPSGWYDERSSVVRPEGTTDEPFAETITAAELGTEWEWEASPELTVVAVDTVAEAVELFNRWSPRFAATLISEDLAEHDRFWAAVDAPFVGDGFTRWVDGQFALDKPELGLSNWEYGRLLARSGVLSGDSVHTVRLRAHQTNAELHR